MTVEGGEASMEGVGEGKGGSQRQVSRRCVCVLQSNEAPQGRMRPVPSSQRGN